MYCNNKEKKHNNYNNNNKCYITTIILYVCLLNIVINNVSLSNEDIISKQEFQKLLDIKHNITGLKKISETMFELMFNTNDDKEKVIKSTIANDDDIKPTTTINDVGVGDNKGSNERTTGGIMSEEEIEKRRKKLFEEAEELIETRNKPEVIYTVDEEKLNLNTIVDLCAILNSSILDSISNSGLMEDAILKVYDNLTILIDQVKLLKSKQPTKQEIAEIVNKAISSYNESTKQSMKESNLYQTQMIQMLKDLTNKVGRLENAIQKVEAIEESTQTLELTNITSGENNNLNNFLKELNNIKTDEKCIEIENFETLFSDDYVKNLVDNNVNINDLNEDTFKDDVFKEFDGNKRMQDLIKGSYALIIETLLDKCNQEIESRQSQNLQPQQELLNAQTEEVAEEEKSEQEKSTNAQEQQQILEPVNQNTPVMLNVANKEEQEEGSEQEKSTNAEEQPLPGQNESSNAQKQQILEPVNQNTATILDIKSEKEQLEELKNTLLQTASKTMLEMQTKMGLCNLLNEQCEMLVNQNNVLRQNFNNLKEEKEFVVGLVKSTNTLLNVVNDGTKEHNLAIVNQINRREQSTGMRVELYENELPEQLTFEGLINNFKQNNEQSMNELKRLDGATVNFDTLALAYDENKKSLFEK